MTSANLLMMRSCRREPLIRNSTKCASKFRGCPAPRYRTPMASAAMPPLFPVPGRFAAVLRSQFAQGGVLISFFFVWADFRPSVHSRGARRGLACPHLQDGGVQVTACGAPAGYRRTWKVLVDIGIDGDDVLVVAEPVAHCLGLVGVLAPEDDVLRLLF